MTQHIVKIHGIVDSETEKKIRELMNGKCLITSIELPTKLTNENKAMSILDYKHFTSGEWNYSTTIHKIEQWSTSGVLPFNICMALHGYVADNYQRLNS